ncbi:DUF3558 family protein [Amycolatopsis suaedae]|uniref:DUF3558 domain-containing protein n=1 Tax=Amycolatopsis suaedae TaxID=2510978 RepID=A0A4V2ELM4_9PSEU|nr:DUF3558 family protein [Amycolatopsis suaedae]RZQ62075.1 DUF3558 domain-containing protein [Amycolatopsis suaedae]
MAGGVARCVVALAVAVLAGCTSTVAGSARPGAGPVPVSDPCALLTADQAAFLELVHPGQLRPGDIERQVPPSCYWEAHEDSATDASFSTAAALDLPMEAYYGGKGPIGHVQFGGLTWEKHADPLTGGGVCSYAIKLSETSFVEIGSSNFSEETKACQKADEAAPFVASHLPGGAPAPSTHRPPHPLTAVAEPCDLLSPQETDQLGVQAQGRRTGTDRGSIKGEPGCEWDSANPDIQSVYVKVSTKEAKLAPYQEQPDEQLDVAGRKWSVYHMNEHPDSCYVILPANPKGGVVVLSGHKTDHSKACERAKAAATAMTPRLPPF